MSLRRKPQAVTSSGPRTKRENWKHHYRTVTRQNGRLVSNIPWSWKTHKFGEGPVEYLVKFSDGSKKGRAVIVMSNDKIFAPKGSSSRMQIYDYARKMFEDSDVHVGNRRMRLIHTFNRGTGERMTKAGNWVQW